LHHIRVIAQADEKALVIAALGLSSRSSYK
jgi:hypothetical protein